MFELFELPVEKVGRWKRFKIWRKESHAFPWFVIALLSSPLTFALVLHNHSYLNYNSWWLTSMAIVLCGLTRLQKAGRTLFRTVSLISGALLPIWLINYHVALADSPSGDQGISFGETNNIISPLGQALFVVGALGLAFVLANRAEHDLDTRENLKLMEHVITSVESLSKRLQEMDDKMGRQATTLPEIFLAQNQTTNSQPPTPAITHKRWHWRK